MIGGSNKKLCVYSRDGIKLAEIGEERDSWVWSCAYHPEGRYVVLSCGDGVVECHQIMGSTVHGLYKDRFVYWYLYAVLIHVQWNLSIPDTIGTAQSVLIKEVSSFQR